MKRMHFTRFAYHRIIISSSKHHKMCLEGSVFVSLMPKHPMFHMENIHMEVSIQASPLEIYISGESAKQGL